MNENHERVCTSPEWAAHLQEDILPVVTTWVQLGARMLEVGPGPGAATGWLVKRVDHLVAVEADPDAAAALAAKYPDAEVVTGDATGLPYPAASFDSVGSFTMLHHVPTRAAQDKLLAEAFRVLRPGGAMLGSDSAPSDGLHHFHEGDTYNPVEPGTLLTRLQTIGFGVITIRLDHAVLFSALKPTG